MSIGTVYTAGDHGHFIYGTYRVQHACMYIAILLRTCMGPQKSLIVLHF